MSPLSNLSAHAESFSVCPIVGARVRHPVAAGAAVCIFMYFEWGGLPVTASSIAPAVRHSADPSCVLAPRESGSDVQYLRARRDLPADTPITLNYYRLPFWVTWPPATVPRSLVTPPPVRLSSVGVVHGVGLVAARKLRKGTVLGAAIEWRYWVVPVVTRDLGRHLNHSATPSAQLVWRDGAWMLTLVRDVVVGGEITVDYGTLPRYCARAP